MTHAARLACAAALVLAALAGCQREAAPAMTPTIGAIEIHAPWVRAMAPNAPAAGGFMRLRNTGTAPDRLLSVASPDAARVEIHTVIHDGDVMRMRPVEGGLTLPPGATVTLAPGGDHLMLVEPQRQFVEGEEVTLELAFERAGTSAVRVPVRPVHATGADGSMHH